MNIPDPSHIRAILRPGSSPRLTILGSVFALIGGLAILLSAFATLASAILIGWMLTLWGAGGLWFAWELRPVPEGYSGYAAFGTSFLLGLVFVLIPAVGAETMTLLIVVVLLMEGVVSILIGLRMSGHVPDWGWMIFSGACSLIVGIVVLVGWPEMAVRTLGLLLGMNFFSTAMALFMLAKAARDSG